MNRRALVPLAATFAALTIVAGGTLGLRVSRSGASGGQALTPARLRAEVTLALPAASYSAAQDYRRGYVYVPSLTGSIAKVTQIDLSTARTRSWDIPAAETNGCYFGQVVVDKLGVVTVSDDYHIVRLDPGTGKVTAKALRFQAKGMTKDAVGGTWISAIAPVGGKLWVIRNGVSAISVYDADLALTNTIPLDADYAGSLSLVQARSGNVLVLSNPQIHVGTAELLDGAGHVIGSGALSATGLSTASNGDVLLEGAVDGMALKGSDLHAFPRLPANVTMSEARVGENAGFVVEYDPQPGEITRTSPSAKQSRLRLLSLNGWVVHMGQEVPVTTRPGVTRTLLSRDGKVWVLFGADARLTSYG